MVRKTDSLAHWGSESWENHFSSFIPGVSYFDCELPRVRRVMEEDPDGFLGQGFPGPLVFDEVHRLKNPSEILKIAADHFPSLRILATGSST